MQKNTKMSSKSLFFIMIVIIINLVSANVMLGNLSHQLQSSYAPSDPLAGWINVSFNKIPNDNLIKGFSSNITINDFLDKNNIDCSISDECYCFPLDCRARYSTIGLSRNSASFNLNLFKAKIIGMRLTGNISEITSFGFNISSDAKESCFTPLIIDLLDDNVIEYTFEDVITDETCFIEKPFGCYNPNNLLGKTIIANNICQKIVIPPVKGFRVGAIINGTGNAHFTMTLDAGGIGGTCTFSASESGDYSCPIILDESLTDYANADVCILADEGNSNLYKINFEDTNVCGYSKDDNNIYGHDFEIYAKPLKYKVVPNFRFDQSFLEDKVDLIKYINNYINSRFNGNCNPECVIPIRIFSGVNQNLNIFNFNLGYNSNGLSQNPITNFYDLDKTPASISSDFIKLDLKKANILVPSRVGEKNLLLKIADKEIRETIVVRDAPKIKNIIPGNPALLVQTKFLVIFEDLNKISKNETYLYTWDFGDGSLPKTSAIDSIEHTYQKKGSYQLTVNISGEILAISKTVSITVTSPHQAINNTLKKYHTNIENVENSLNLLPSWIEDRIRKISDLDGLKGAIDRLEKNYKETFGSEEDKLIEIMNSLVVLNVPTNIVEDRVINPSPFIQSKERLDINVLEEIGAGTVNEEKDKYYDSINKWLRENMDTSFESKTYIFTYEDASDEILLSHLKLIIKPKKEIEEFYVVIEGNPSEIKFNEDYGERELNSGLWIGYSLLPEGELKTIEFLYPSTIEFLDLPIYVSPEFRKLEFGFDPGVCNYNNVCEDDFGETYKNCRNDCKPYTLTIIYLIILIFVALLAYIILQEWYKRYYQSHLFHDNNQFFNLMAFMKNAELNKLNKKQIFEKLLPYKWTHEQLTFAWNKYHGKRTGMWEIPIFIKMQKKKVNEELEKRKKLGIISNDPNNLASNHTRNKKF
mgnify:CR=1 FL=1